MAAPQAFEIATGSSLQWPHPLNQSTGRSYTLP
jgi:hypothetical protein